MDQSLCKLTLVYPPPAEDGIIELLLASDPPLPGFTSWTADGHGMGFDNASPGEKVRGRVRRCVLTLIATRGRIRALLDEIAAHLAIPRLLYWLEPVLEVGRLTDIKPAATPSLEAAAPVEDHKG
jgi:hypothetical protein